MSHPPLAHAGSPQSKRGLHTGHRIPLKSVPKTVAVDWLAFYQTAKFGEDK